MTRDGPVEVLLVEDDHDDARHVQRLLVEFGSVGEELLEVGECYRAERVGEAGELLTERTPDIVLLDLMLPDSEGMETVDALVDCAPTTPIVVITGSGDAELGTNAIRRGAQDFLQKGQITGELLHRTLRYAIDRHEQQREIVELNRRLSLLNRIVRGDVRSDLSVVVGRGDELRAHLDPAGEPVLESLLDAADHAVERTDAASELLAVLSTESDLHLESIDVADLVESQVTAARANHEATFTVDPSTDGAEDATVEGTPMLGAAFEQLLSNAVEHADDERPAVTVTIEPTASSVAVAIADEGRGIPADQRALLNDPETRYHERSGIGTGLYLATTVVEQCGGTVAFDDNDPAGTVVTVTLERGGDDRDSSARSSALDT